MHLCFLIFAAYLLSTSVGFSWSTYVKLHVSSTANGETATVCANIQPPAHNSTQIKPQSEFIVNEIQDANSLCLDKQKVDLTGQIVVDIFPINQFTLHGQCSRSFYFTPKERILRSQEKNASAVLFRKADLYSAFYEAEFQNDSDIHIPILFINEYNYKAIRQLKQSSSSGNVVLKLLPSASRLLSGSFAILLLMTLICIICGGIWSGYQRISLALAAREKAALEEGQATPDKPSVGKVEQKPAEPLNCLSLGFLLLFVVAFLLLFYYFFNILVWFMIVLFTLLTSVSTYYCLSLALKACLGGSMDSYKINLWFPMSKFFCCFTISQDAHIYSYREIFTFLLSAAISVTWCVLRKHPFAFILHNLLSIMFCINTIASVRISSLKWITALLSALLIYDLFMVFITPFFTSQGCSIMVEAVTGGACSQKFPSPPDPNKEEIPIVFRVPDFTEKTFSCYNVTTDLQYPPVILGFGDVILPGILIGFNFAFDLGWKIKPRVYFLVGVAGYFVGMLVTFAALVFMKMAQPALIYLVPFTLIPTHLFALCKGHWWYMWNGHVEPPSRAVSSHLETQRATGEDDCDSKPLSTSNS